MAVVDVVVTAAGFILAEGSGVAAHRRSHAQTRIAVDVVAFEAGLENLAGQIGFLGEGLSGAVVADGLGAMLLAGPP